MQVRVRMIRSVCDQKPEPWSGARCGYESGTEQRIGVIPNSKTNHHMMRTAHAHLLHLCLIPRPSKCRQAAIGTRSTRLSPFLRAAMASGGCKGGSWLGSRGALME